MYRDTKAIIHFLGAAYFRHHSVPKVLVFSKVQAEMGIVAHIANWMLHMLNAKGTRQQLVRRYGDIWGYGVA